MGSYSGYRGRSAGRILHCLDTYCDTYHPRLQETACVGDGKITYQNTQIAYYYWPDEMSSLDRQQWASIPEVEESDVPIIHFCDNSKLDASLIQRFNRNNFISRPFLDEMMPQTADYLVQEIRKVISLDDALAIQFIRDKHEGDWERVSWYGRPRAEQRIKTNLAKNCFGYWDNDKINKYWKHLAMCTIYGLAQV